MVISARGRDNDGIGEGEEGLSICSVREGEMEEEIKLLLLHAIEEID